MTELVRVSQALYAQVAFVLIFDFHLLHHFIIVVYFSRAETYEFFSLLGGHVAVNYILFKRNQWLFVHDARCYWGPFGVLLADTLAGN